MAFKFRKRVKILPGISLNFSKSGVSTSIGTRGARVTLGRGKVRQTVGIPGTGISYSKTSKVSEPKPVSSMSFGKALLWGFVALLIFVAVAGALTT